MPVHIRSAEGRSSWAAHPRVDDRSMPTNRLIEDNHTPRVLDTSCERSNCQVIQLAKTLGIEIDFDPMACHEVRNAVFDNLGQTENIPCGTAVALILKSEGVEL